MKTDSFDFMSLPEIDAEGNVLPAATDNGGGDSGFDFMSLPEVDAPVGQIETMSPGDFKGAPAMGGATEQALMAQSQGGPEAARDDGSLSSWFRNAWNTIAHNSSGRVASGDVNWKTQRVMEGVAEKEGGKRVSFLDLPDSELDDYMNSVAPNGYWGYIGNALGFGGKNDMMAEWDRTEGVKYTDEAERKKARVQYAMDIAKGNFMQTEQAKQFAQAELEGREKQWQAGVTGGGLQTLGYMLPALAPGGAGLALSAAVEGGARRNELLADKYETDADGNLRMVAKGDTRGEALAKGAVGGVVQSAIEKVGGELAGKAIGRAASKIPGVEKLSKKFAGTVAGRAVNNFYKPFKKLFEKTGLDDAPSEFLEELEQGVTDATFGLDRRQSEMPDGMVSLERGWDATKEFFKPENMWDLAQGLLLVQLAGGGVAHLKERHSSKVADGILRNFAGVDEAKLKDLDAETKWKMIDSHYKGMSGEQMAEIFDKGAKEAADLLRVFEQERLGTFDGRLQLAQSNPEAMKRIYEAREAGKDVSRRMMQDLGVDGSLYGTVAERNAFADQLLQDREQYKMRLKAEAELRRTKMDEVQRTALADEIESLGIPADSKEYGDLWLNVVGQIKDAKELDDPTRRTALVQGAFEQYVKENGELNVQFTADDGATYERSWTYNPPKQETTDETGNGADEAPAQPISERSASAVQEGQAAVAVPQGAQSGEATRVVEPSESERDKKKIAGLDMTVGKAKQLLREDVEAKLADIAGEWDVPISIKGIELHGSRVRGDARNDSDLDLVVEYEGDVREDDLFSALNESPIDFNGLKVDVNPIRADETGTLADYMKGSAEYDAQKMAKTAPTSASAETQPITPPKATESAEGGISPSDGTLTPEQAATERKKGKRIPKTEAKEESAPTPAPVQPTQSAAKQQTVKEATAEFIAAHTKTDEKSGKRVLNNDINRLGELTPPTPYIGKTHGKIEKPKKVTDEASAVGVMKDIASSDGVRQSYGNLHVENGTMVATNGSMAMVAPAPKGLNDGNYKATKRGDPNAGFPQNWKQVVPNISGKKSSYSRVGVIENGDKSVGAIEYADSVSAAMKRVDKESNHVTVKVGDAFINPEYMRKTTRAMFRLGVGNIEVFASGANAPIVLKGRNANGEVTGVIMPLRYDGHGNVATDKVTHVRLFGKASQPKSQPKPQAKAAPKAEGSGAKSPSVGKKSATPTPTTASAFKRGERVFLKSAEKNQAVTFIKANNDGTVDVQVRTPGANRYMPATTETRTVPASEVTATGLKGSLSSKEKADLEKGRESEAPLRANLAASGILGSPERSAPLKGEDGTVGKKGEAPLVDTPNTAESYDEARKVLSQKVGKPFKNEKADITATLSGNSINKLLSGKAVAKSVGVKEHLKAVANVVELFQDGDLKDVEPGGRRGVNSAKKIFARFSMGKDEYVAKITVLEYDQGDHRIYSVEAMEVEKAGSILAPGNENSAVNPTLPSTPNKVSQGAPKVNRAEKKSEKNPLGQVVPPEDGSVAQAVDREIAQGIPPAPAPGSAANENLNPDYEPESVGLGVKDPVSRQQIVDRFKELFGDTVAIRGRNTSRIGASYSGHYEIGPGIIRSKKPVSMRTIPHEVGHHIDLLLKRTGRARPAAVRMDLAKLGRKLYGTKAPNGGYEAEGFAEIVKYYLQGNDAGLKKEAPAAYDWLVNQFGKDNPDVMAKLDDLRGMIDRLQNQSGEDAVRAIRAKDPSLTERGLKKIKNLIDAVDPSAENWLDQGAFISKGMKASGLDQLMDWRKAMKDGDAAKMNEIIENHPVLKWKLYNGKAGARAYQAISKGLTDLSGTRRYTYGDLGMETPGHAADEEIPTFKEIFGDFSKKEMDEFQDYAIARVAKESYIDKGLEFGLTAKEVEPVLRKYADNAKFREALEKYTHYKHGVLHLLVDAGAMSQEQFRAIVDANPIYVKIARRRESTDLFRDRMLKRRGRAVNKRTGSGRQVEDIFDAGLVDDERVFAAAFQADVFRSLVNLGKKGEQAGGSGAGFSIGANWLHEVPNAQGAVKFKAEKLRKQITDAMQSAGITVDKEGANTIFDQIFDDGKDTLTIFKEKPSNGKNGVVSLYDQDGNLHTYELPENNAKGWAEGLMGFTDAQKPNILEKWAQIAAAATRSGATVLNPVFAVRNIVRDSLHAAVANEVGVFIPGVSTVHGIAMDLFNSNPKKMFESMGLQMGSMLGEARLNSARKSNRYIMSKTWYERAWNRGVIKSIADFVGFSENGSRIKEFKNVHDYMLKNGASEKAAAMLAGANALDITIDFQRGGKMARRINKIYPFFNASIQGLEQTARMIGAIPPKEWQLLGSRKERAIRTLLTGGATITTIALLAELFNHADDDRKERMKELPPHEKWNYIPFGDVRIPVPFEIGYIFASIPRAVYAEMVDGDEGAVAECLYMMWKTFPGLSPKNIALLGPMLRVAMNETWTGAAIVPEYAMKGKESYDWVNDRTTEFSKRLAKAFHPIFGNSYMASPAHLDALFNEMTGNMYGRIVGIVDLKRDFDSSRPNTWPVLGTLFRNNATASRVVGDFYERRAELTRKKGSKKTTSYEESELKVMDRRAKVMKNLRKQAQAIKEKAGLSAKERNDRLEEIALKIQSIARYHLREWKK